MLWRVPRKESDLIHHVRLIHADRAFSVRCRGCGRNKLFNNFYTWCDHMYSHHCESEPQKQPVPGPSESVVLDPEDTFNDEELAFEPEASPDNFACANLQHAATTFILQVQETHQLPQTTMDIIVKEIDSIYQVRKMGIYN